MKTQQETFLRDEVEIMLSDFRNEMIAKAKAVSKFTTGEYSTNPRVIDIKKWNMLLDNLHHIEANQIVESKLRSVQVYGFEREDFEDRRWFAGNVKSFLNEFQGVDYLSENVFYELLNKCAIPFHEAQQQNGKFLLVEDLTSSVPLRLLIACIRNCADGHNAWYGIYSTRNIHKLQAKLNTADKFTKTYKIIPIDVYRDAIEIIKIVDLHQDINNFLITKSSYLRFTSDDVEADRTILEGLLTGFIEKYPFLSDKNYQKFGAVLLNCYTMKPALLIERMGSDVICFPYSVPNEFELPEDKKIEWEEEFVV